jgi:hypothetical protein
MRGPETLSKIEEWCTTDVDLRAILHPSFMYVA